MTNSNNHSVDSVKRIFPALALINVIFYLFYTLKTNHYELLFVDERLLIDDIYNVWLFDDAFNRFQNIKNNNLQNLLIFLTEVAYGGDLRYGRLWSNIYTVFSGPFLLISDQALISSSRILNVIVLTLSFYNLSKMFVKKSNLWISVLFLYSLPGVEFLNRFPKPETFALLFTTFGFYYLRNDRPFISIFFFGVASFLKINFIIILFICVLYLLTKSKNKILFIFKSFITTYLALILVNPILIVPPLNIFGIQAPNFYFKYFEWILSQGSYGQTNIFSINYFLNWLSTLGKFYSVPSFIVFMVLVITFIILFRFISKNKDAYSILFILISSIYFLFYMFFIERQFLWYINIPMIFLTITIFRNFEIKKFNIKLLFTIIFLTLGLFSNINEHLNSKVFTANYKYDYENIFTEEDAIRLVDNVVLNISNLYEEKNDEILNKVFWNPNMFIPRNKVTYFNDFYVREYWDSLPLEEILSQADFFVTNEEFDNFKYVKVANYFIYFK